MRGPTQRAGFSRRWFFGLEGFLKRTRFEAMKATIDIPENALADVLIVACAKRHGAGMLMLGMMATMLRRPRVPERRKKNFRLGV
jgi:hypothetical protein